MIIIIMNSALFHYLEKTSFVIEIWGDLKTEILEFGNLHSSLTKQ